MPMQLLEEGWHIQRAQDLTLLKTPLRMGSHTKKNHCRSRSAPFPSLAPQFAMESKPPGSCCQNLPTA